MARLRKKGQKFAKLPSRKPSINSEGFDKIYPYHAKALRRAGLAHPNLPTMGDLWINQDEKLDIEKESYINKNKNRNVYYP